MTVNYFDYIYNLLKNVKKTPINVNNCLKGIKKLTN